MYANDQPKHDRVFSGRHASHVDLSGDNYFRVDHKILLIVLEYDCIQRQLTELLNAARRKAERTGWTSEIEDKFAEDSEVYESNLTALCIELINTAATTIKAIKLKIKILLDLCEEQDAELIQALAASLGSDLENFQP